jgi:hypothetical protein
VTRLTAAIDADRGDAQFEQRHRREADLHTRAALCQEDAAALQRRHAERLLIATQKRTRPGG